MGDIKLILLNNGLQIMGEVVGTEAADASLHAQGKVLVAKPVSVMMMPSKTAGSTQTQIGFGSFLEYVEEYKTGIPLHVTDILTIVTPVEDLLRHYKTLFSGLVLPPGING
jgi:hypothetical protein